SVVICATLSLAPSFFLFFLLLLPRPPRSTLFPYTTLFRSADAQAPTVRTGTTEVLVDVVVRDKKSKIVRDLKPEEIQVQIAHNLDRKSTRLNSSHVSISYAVFCLKKKKKKKKKTNQKNNKNIQKKTKKSTTTI